MNNELVLNILYQTLGHGKKTARNNYAFKCPNNCHPTKHKLEINLETHKYQCWICGGQKDGYKGKNLIKLLKRVDVPLDKINELKSLINYRENNNNEELIYSTIELPKEFKPLLNIQKSDIIGRHALVYLKKRNTTKEDILKYNIGYCEEGPYKNMIIIPSYDENGNLNYFMSRSFEKEPKIKTKNPPLSRNIIPFELFINWDLPIILCEGPFDALAIKRNVIPLLGKNIQSNLMKKIILSSVNKIYIALDKDAQKQALYFCEQLLNEGKEVYLVDVQEKDPSELGFQKFTEIISKTYPLTLSNLMYQKLNQQ
jgi:hypothetical protein